MQRLGELRCIVSNCVVYAKIWDTRTGYPIFFMPVGLEPKVRVWGARGALPGAGGATRASGCGLYFRGGFDRRRKYRAPQQDTRHFWENVSNCAVYTSLKIS